MSYGIKDTYALSWYNCKYPVAAMVSHIFNVIISSHKSKANLSVVSWKSKLNCSLFMGISNLEEK